MTHQTWAAVVEEVAASDKRYPEGSGITKVNNNRQQISATRLTRCSKYLVTICYGERGHLQEPYDGVDNDDISKVRRTCHHTSGSLGLVVALEGPATIVDTCFHH